MTACKSPTCGRPAVSIGYCSAHYSRVRRYGNAQDDTPVRHANRYGVRCCVTGCVNKGRTIRGLCPSHYSRLQRTGSANPEIPIRDRLGKVEGGEPCSILGCSKSIVARGKCSVHYKREKSAMKSVEDIRVCRVDGCDHMLTNGSGRGLCPSHYSRSRSRAGLRPEMPLGMISRKEPNQCSVKDCERPSAALGECAKHYRRTLHARKKQAAIGYV